MLRFVYHWQNKHTKHLVTYLFKPPPRTQSFPLYFLIVYALIFIPLYMDTLEEPITWRKQVRTGIEDETKKYLVYIARQFWADTESNADSARPSSRDLGAQFACGYAFRGIRV